MWGPIVKVLMRQSVAALHAVYVAGGSYPEPVRVRPRRIQIVGDSDSAGFGIDGPDKVARAELSSTFAAGRARRYPSPPPPPPPPMPLPPPRLGYVA